ncbi:restriction endonuclease subunit S [Streptomyces sp. NPDC005004]
MSEWVSTTLGEFVHLQRGHDLPSGQRVPGPIPVVGSGGVTGWHSEPKASGPGITIGRAANLGVPTLVEQDFWPLNTTLYVTDFRGNNVRFTYHLFQVLDLAGFNSGSVQPMLNRNYISSFPIEVPERAEQDAIAAVLGALEAKIAVNERIATTYEQLLQYRYAELGLAEDPNPETAVPITDLVTFNPKMGKPPAEEPIYVDMAALQTHLASIPSWTRRVPKSGPRFKNGDTLLARITPCLENGKTGYVDFMEDGEIGLGSTEFIVMRSLPGVPSELSYFLARDGRFRAHAIRNMVGTSGRQRVSATDAANYQVNRPDADALTAFGKDASASFAHMKSLQAESRTLATLRDTLLPQLMSGRLRVKDAEKIVEDAT